MGRDSDALAVAPEAGQATVPPAATSFVQVVAVPTRRPASSCRCTPHRRRPLRHRVLVRLAPAQPQLHPPVRQSPLGSRSRARRGMRSLAPQRPPTARPRCQSDCVCCPRRRSCGRLPPSYSVPSSEPRRQSHSQRQCAGAAITAAASVVTCTTAALWVSRNGDHGGACVPAVRGTNEIATVTTQGAFAKQRRTPQLVNGAHASLRDFEENRCPSSSSSADPITQYRREAADLLSGAGGLCRDSSLRQLRAAASAFGKHRLWWSAGATLQAMMMHLGDPPEVEAQSSGRQAIPKGDGETRARGSTRRTHSGPDLWRQPRLRALLKEAVAELVGQRAWSRAVAVTEVFEGMQADKSCGPKSFVTTIQACGEGYHWELAVVVFRRMRRRGFETGPIALTAVMSAFELAEKWQLALGVLRDELPGMSIRPDDVAFRVAVRVCWNGHHWQSAVGLLLHAMPAAGIPLSIAPWNYVVDTCARGDQARKALRLVCQMRETRVRPNQLTYRIVAQACERGLLWESVGELLLTAHAIDSTVVVGSVEDGARGPPRSTDAAAWGASASGPGELAFSAALRTCQKVKQWLLCCALLSEMRRRSIAPGTIGFCVAISTCGDGRQWQAAVGLLVEMRSLGVEVNLITWTAAVKAAEKEQQWELAAELLGQVRQSGLQMEVISVSTAVSAIAQGQVWRCTLALLRDAQSRRVQANVVSYGATLTACCAPDSSGGKSLSVASRSAPVAPPSAPRPVPRGTVVPRLIPVDDLDVGREATDADSELRLLWRCALGLLVDMSVTAVAPSQITTSICISACEKALRWDCALLLLTRAERDAESAFRANATMETQQHTSAQVANNAGPGPDAATYNAAVRACDKGRQWKEAFRVLGRMRHGKLQLSVVSHNTAMGVWIPASMAPMGWSPSPWWALAVDAIGELRRRGLAADSATYATASSVCERALRWQLVLSLLLERQQGPPRDFPPPDTAAVNSAVSVCGAARQWRWSMALFHDMAEGGDVPDSASGSHSDRGSGQQDAARPPSTTVAAPHADAVSCTAVINACDSRQQWHWALEVADRARWIGVKPDLVAHNALTSAAGKGTQWRLSLGHLEVLERRRLVADIITFNALISACEEASRWEVVLALLDEILKRRIAPDKITINSAISACENGWRWQNALELLAELKASAEFGSIELEPDAISFNAVVSACSKAGKQQIVLDLLQEMQTWDLLPDKVTFTAALVAFGGHWQQSLRLLDAMQHQTVHPNCITYSLALAACEQGLQGKRAIELLVDTDSVAVQLVEALPYQ